MKVRNRLVSLRESGFVKYQNGKLLWEGMKNVSIRMVILMKRGDATQIFH
jgi:hypothetical protein